MKALFDQPIAHDGNSRRCMISYIGTRISWVCHKKKTMNELVENMSIMHLFLALLLKLVLNCLNVTGTI